MALIALLQRVTRARVEIAGDTVAEIGRGVLALVCAERDDRIEHAVRLAERVCGYRIFPDSRGRMNLSVVEIGGGGILAVPQFTLAADTSKGMRPSLSRSADPQLGRALFAEFVRRCAERCQTTRSGEFAADMQVSLTNDGPVTVWLQIPSG